MKLILCRGCPGSGKSTFVKTAFPGIFHVENDMWHMKDGEYRFNPKKQSTAISWCMDMVRTALENGMDVVVSNTFTKKGYIEAYRKMAEELGADFVVYRMRGEFNNTHAVPGEILENMRKNFADWPGETNVYPNGEDADMPYSCTNISVGDKIKLRGINGSGTVTAVLPATYGFINVFYRSDADGSERLTYAGDCMRVSPNENKIQDGKNEKT